MQNKNNFLHKNCNILPKDRGMSINRLKDIETNEELTPIEKIVRCLVTTDINDMEKVVGEGMKSILDKVMELSSDEKLVGLYNKEELAEAREYGIHLAGIKEGIKEGIEQGIQETKKQVVINMLKDNLDIVLISKYTNLSIEEIYEIKETLN